MITVWVSTMST